MLTLRFLRQYSRIKMQKDYEYLYGINPVMIAINTNRRTISKLYVSDSEGANMNARVSNIVHRCRKLAIDIEFVKKEALEKACPNQPHQNVLLKCSPLNYVNIESPDELTGKGISLFLDQITDPQNLGAIIRSCFYFKVDSLLVSPKHRCPLNSTISKTSSGALELINIHSVKNPLEFLRAWKRRSNHRVLSTGSQSPNSNIPVWKLNDYHKHNSSRPRELLLVGSEGAGVSPQLVQQSDAVLSVPKYSSDTFPESLVDSLNVNAAVCTILYEMTRNSD